MGKPQLSDSRTGACAIPNCINRQVTVGPQGAEEIPHPTKSTCFLPPIPRLRGGKCGVAGCVVGDEEHLYLPERCRERGFPNGKSGDRYVPVRPLRDDPITTNAEGGSQSVIHETFTTLPLRALRAVAQLQRLGDQKYGAHNWRKIDEVDHIDHGFAHMLGHSSGDDTEDHLLHAAWRLLAALEVRLTEREKNAENQDR